MGRLALGPPAVVGPSRGTKALHTLHIRRLQTVSKMPLVETPFRVILHAA